MFHDKSRAGRRILLVIPLAIGLTLSAGIAYADDNGDHGGRRGLGLPGVDNDSLICGITSSDPRKHRTCNHDGGNGFDGRAGYRNRSHGVDDSLGRGPSGDEDYPDVNGAPVRDGSPWAYRRPGVETPSDD